MPKDFLQGASLTPTFIQHFTVIILLPFLMLKNAFKKHPLQNRTNVQIKGGGFKGLLNNVQKNCTFLKRGLPLVILMFSFWYMRSRPSTVSSFSASSCTTKFYAQNFYSIQDVVIRKWAELTLWRLNWQPFRSSPKPKIHQISFVHIHKTMWGNPSFPLLWVAGYFP